MSHDVFCRQCAKLFRGDPSVGDGFRQKPDAQAHHVAVNFGFEIGNDDFFLPFETPGGTPDGMGRGVLNIHNGMLLDGIAIDFDPRT